MAGAGSILGSKKIHMRKNILIFGSLAGLIITSNMVYWSTVCTNNPEFESNDTLGYAGMIIAFSFIFFGIKNFRDRQNDGVISFGQAFKMGFFMALVASTMYVGVWLIHYHFFVPDFIDSYEQHVLYEAKLKGLTDGELEQKAQEMAKLKEWYKNPLFVILLSYGEVLPVATLIALISALILKRKPGLDAAAEKNEAV